MEKFLAWLDANWACDEGMQYVKRFSSPEDFWANCYVSDYMAWLLFRVGTVDTSTRIRILLCMHEAILEKVAGADTIPGMAQQYAALVAGRLPAPLDCGNCGDLDDDRRLVQRFLTVHTSYGWTYLYEVLGGDACALIRKHFPTLPLNLGD